MAQSNLLRQQVREYILSHPTEKNTQVMDATGASMRTVSNVRAQLRMDGMPPAYGDRKTKRVNAAATITGATADTFDPQTTSDLNKAVSREAQREAAANAAADAMLGPDGEIDVLELKKMLWRVVQRNRDDRIVVAAASALSRIQQEVSSRPLGPGKPMSKRDAKDRFIMMMQAVGIDFVLECINEWTGYGKPKASEAHPSISPSTSPTTAGA